MPLMRLSQRGNGALTAIGAMNRLITIQTRTATNSDGQPDGPYTDVLTTWAKNQHTGGKVTANTAELVADVTDIWTMPYVSGVDPNMRIQYVDLSGKNHYYEILFVQNLEERGFFLELLAKEIVTAN